MERRVGKTRISAFRIGCAVNDIGDLAPSEGSGTHETWLNRDVKRAVGQIFSAEGLRSGGYGLHLGVGGYVGQLFGQIMAPAHDATPADHDGPYRNLVIKSGRAGFFESHAHEAFVGRVCYLIGHHHTYTGVTGMDYQLLIEADFLVNAFEDGLPEENIRNVRANLFKSEAGKKLLDEIFAL